MPRVALIESPDAGPFRGPASCGTALRAAGVEVATFDRRQLGDAAAAEPDRIVVAGGDGSIGPAAELAARTRVPLAVVPTGTANNFAAAEGLPTAIEDACRLAAAGERTRTLELGRASGVPFVNVASAGLAPAAAELAARWKRLLGPSAYSVGAVAAALTTPPLECSVAAPGGPVFGGRCWQAMVAVSGAFGPGVRIESTDTTDGFLDLVVLPAGPRAELLRRGWWIRRGRIASQPGAIEASGSEFDLDVPPGTPFNVDGEVIALGPTRFTVEPRAFELVVP